ncbi:hypothetical protein QTI24_11840 [Variovorax sp. J22P240]|uniref:hypothetical protein n=1 Tax=unclassified Variovorax TaxID=663243 RepID=UPI0025768C29|nr:MULTISPECIES: hypothetical protein [unclassified Variovorax]MDL9999299.1 hypothetical protein [Variovorax sp. J22P240]MDM0052584.1 hypothetical protein [Variovorax sp. J22R115]
MDDANPDESPLPPPQDATDNATSNDHAKRRRLDSTRVLFISFSTPDVHPCTPSVCRAFEISRPIAVAKAGAGIALIYTSNGAAGA